MGVSFEVIAPEDSSASAPVVSIISSVTSPLVVASSNNNQPGQGKMKGHKT
jgi:hypothetical protein